MCTCIILVLFSIDVLLFAVLLYGFWNLAMGGRQGNIFG